MNRHQQRVIDYLIEENRILKEKFRGKRIRFTDNERRRLAVRGKALGGNLTGALGGFLAGKRILIMDRDKKYCEGFRSLMEESGTNVVRLPLRSSNVNTYAERFVLSIKQEYLNQMIFFSEKSLCRAVSVYVAHYHRE